MSDTVVVAGVFVISYGMIIAYSVALQ